MNPVITALSGWFAALLAGAFFVEFIFNFKGLGFVTVNALLNYDIPVILGALLFTCSSIYFYQYCCRFALQSFRSTNSIIIYV